jgi:hypothetical protein
MAGAVFVCSKLAAWGYVGKGLRFANKFTRSLSGSLKLNEVWLQRGYNGRQRSLANGLNILRNLL